MGMTLQEIADELGISKQMVYKIEQRALRKARDYAKLHGLTLRELLGNEEPETYSIEEQPRGKARAGV